MLRAARRRKTPVLPLHAFLFAVALSAALIVVLVPVLPGETPLDAGDFAYKTFEDGGTVIAEQGETVTASDLRRIEAAGLLDNDLSLADAMAAVIVAVLSATLLAVYLAVFQPQKMNTVRSLVLFGAMIVLWVAAAKIFLSLTLPDDERLFLSYMLPIAVAAMLTATIIDGGLAILVAALLAVLTAFAGYYMPDARNTLSGSGALEPLQMVATFFLAGVAGVVTVRQAESVNRYVFAGMATAAVSFVTVLGFWLLMPGRDGVDVVWMIVAASLGGFGAAILAVGATITLGVLVGVTTRIQLMELSQLNHPLLQRLQEDTPGTFHHSMQVGTLAERAADLVGADALLARVGAYYHDIGKVENPRYYIENQADSGNPHDDLDPQTSAGIIFKHVSDGLRLTKAHRLPARVRAFVPEHHGTRLVTYFYHKACEDNPYTDPEPFRYPGPRPQSRETGIVMLADSVEAIVRASKDHSFEKIDELVDQVVAERMAEGQMDDCELTMRDLRTIAESFKSTLRGIYHKRIEYPPMSAAEEQTDHAEAAPRRRGRGSGAHPPRVEVEQ